MLVEQHEVEGSVISMYRDASVDPEREPGAIRLAHSMGYELTFVDGLPMRGAVTVDPVHIRIRREMAPAGREYCCGHEIGHIANDCLACGDPRLEQACDRIAVAIVAPRPAMFLLRSVFGDRILGMANALGTSELIVALRWGVVFDESVAVVLDRGGVRRSGPEIQLSDRVLRAIAKSGGGRGFRAIKLGCGVMLVGAT